MVRQMRKWIIFLTIVVAVVAVAIVGLNAYNNMWFQRLPTAAAGTITIATANGNTCTLTTDEKSARPFWTQLARKWHLTIHEMVHSSRIDAMFNERNLHR